MANNFVKKLDRQQWVAVSPSNIGSQSGTCLAGDMRNDESAMSRIWAIYIAALSATYNVVQKSWQNMGANGMNLVGAGAGNIFAPSFSIYGTLAAGCTTTTVIVSTGFPAAVGLNNLANEGIGIGYRIRIIGNAAGSSGKVEERMIIGNTLGSTPTIALDTALTFTPAAGDSYEILSGRIFMLSASTLVVNSWRAVHAAVQSFANLGTTNLPAVIGTGFAAVALDELYVPYDHKPGEGFVVGAGIYDLSGTIKNCLIATATAAGTLTGQAAGGDATVLGNEYRNFQIRIVEDTAIPTAVNQRAIIASHTAGASPVYTLGANWAVTPSATAKYVIEYPNLIMLQSSATTSWYTYNYTSATINNGTNTIAANAWSTTYFAAAANAMGTGCVLFPSFGIEPDSAKNSRHSFIYRIRGGGVTNIDLFDISGETTGAWTASINVYGAIPTIGDGSCGVYAPAANEGKYGYFNFFQINVINQMFAFNVKNRTITPLTSTDWIQTGATGYSGNRIAAYTVINGIDKYTNIFLQMHSSTICYELLIQT